MLQAKITSFILTKIFKKHFCNNNKLKGGILMRNFSLFLIVFVVVAALFLGCGPKEGVLGKAGKEEVTVDDLEKMIGMRTFNSFEDELEMKTKAVERVLQEKLILIAAYDEKYDTLPDIQKQIESTKGNRMLQALFVKAIEEKSKDISDAEITEAHEKMKEQIKAQHILVTSKELADSILQKYKAGTPFEELAREYSLDKSNKDRGGELDWFTCFSFDPNFEKAAYALKGGEVSEPVQSRIGWHIIKVNQRRPNTDIGTLEEETSKLTKILESYKQREITMKFLEDLKTSANIQLNPEAAKIVLSELSILPPPETFMQPNAPEPPEIVFPEKDMLMTLATWNGGSWTIAQFDSAFKTIPPFRRGNFKTDADISTLLFILLQGRFLEAKAVEMNIEESDAYANLVKTDLERRILDLYRRNVIINVEVTEEDAKEYYDANSDSFMNPERISVIEIQVASPEESNNLIAKIKKGEDARKLASENTLRKNLKDRGGEMQITEKRYPELFRAAKSVQPGQVVPTPIQYQGKFSVLKVEGILPASPRPYDQVKRLVINKLRSSKRTEATDEWNTQAQKKYGYKIYEKAIIATIEKDKYETPESSE
jgi:parvulin-like peptidyl-prolyl isomerase